MRVDFRILMGPMEDRGLYHPDEIEKKGFEGRGS
jgi:hypothetical protein